MLKKERYIQWANEFECVGEIWIPKYHNEHRKIQNSRLLMRYCKFVQKTPDQLLKLKEDHYCRHAELLLTRYYNTSKDTYSTKFATVNAVKSFFRSNFRDLHSDTVKMVYRKENYNEVTKEKLTKLYRFCTNPRDRALLQFICSTACAKYTISKAKWKHLEHDWLDEEIPLLTFPSKLIKGRGFDKYFGVKQTTFLTPQAKQDLLEYKMWYEKTHLGREFHPEENIFWQIRITGRDPNPLSYEGVGNVFKKLQSDSGVAFSPHDGRRWVETGLENNGVVENWARRIRGRKVRGSESPYSRPAIEQLREKYRRAVPDLQFLPQASEDIIENAVMSAMAKLNVLLDDPSISNDKKEEAKQYLRNLTKKVTKQNEEKRLLESNPTKSKNRTYIF